MLLTKDKVSFIIIFIVLNCLLCKKGVEAAGTEILRKGNSFIKIKEISEENKSVYGEPDHPCSLSEKEIAALLSNISFQKKGILGSEKTERVFSGINLKQVLAPLLAKGFARVNSNQYLLVYNSLARSFFKNKHNYFCTFVVNNNLYVIFGRIHHDLTFPYFDEENIVRNGIEFENPMDEKKTGFWQLIPSPGLYLRPGRENVLIIPVDRKDTFLAADKKKNYTAEFPKKKLNDKGSTIISGDDNRKPVDAGNNTKEDVSYSLKEQLRLLKNLLEEGLISDENYERKKNELLDEYFGAAKK